MRILFVLIIITFTNCKKQEKEIENISIKDDFCKANEQSIVQKEIKYEKIDSIKIIASKFIWFNEFSKPQKYVIEEPDIEDFYQKYPKESKKYFPLIRERYQLDFNEDFFLRCYIFLLGNKDVFSDIDFSKLDEEQNRIVELNFKNFNISIK